MGESRPAGLALLVLGAAGLAIALGVGPAGRAQDLATGQRFAEAQGEAGARLLPRARGLGVG